MNGMPTGKIQTRKPPETYATFNCTRPAPQTGELFSPTRRMLSQHVNPMSQLHQVVIASQGLPIRREIVFALVAVILLDQKVVFNTLSGGAPPDCSAHAPCSGSLEIQAGREVFLTTWVEPSASSSQLPSHTTPCRIG